MTRKQKKNLIRICIAAVLAVAAYLVVRFTDLPWWAQLIIFAVPYLVIGYDVLIGAGKNIVHGQVFDERFLMVVATFGAFAIREFPEAVAVMLFYQVGELFQSIAVGKSRRSIAALMDIRPDTATVIRDGVEVVVSPEEVAEGERLIVRVGEKIPLDGVILSGSTAVNTAALTGESLPVDKAVGDTIISGCVNLNGVIEIEASGVYEESTVSKILTLVENSAEKKAKSENFITKFAKYYTPAVVVCAVLLAVIPPLATGGSWKEWIYRALTFLVVSCPCALVISVPLSFFGGIGGASRRGILIKGSNYLEALAKVGSVVFDKTGTLTEGRFKVTEICPEGIAGGDLVALAAHIESFSNHPIAQSVVEAYGLVPDKDRVTAVEEKAGHGICGSIEGKTVAVGNALLMKEMGIIPKECDKVGTVVHVAEDGKYLGYILISDVVKADAKQAIADLKNLGVERTVMLTGDGEKAARAIAMEVGVDEYKSELLPENKVTEIEGILTEKNTTVFVGDGINDAPVLVRADVGIAMGGIGSDAAIEAADIVIMDDKPSKIAETVDISRRTMRIVYENIVFALGVKIAVLVLGALGIAGMWLAVFADVGVAVIAILNALRAGHKHDLYARKMK